MSGIVNYELYLFAALTFALTPGPDTLYVLGRSVAQGRHAGVYSTLGISAGALVHCAFAAVGLSAVLASSAFAFSAVKYAGAAYLVYLGVRSLWHAGSLDVEAVGELGRSASVSTRKLFLEGVATNVLNPKVALFFLAFIPQFVDPAHAGPLPFLLLGSTLIAIGSAWLLVVAAFAGRAARMLRDSARVRRWLDRTVGAIFLALGARLALVE